MKNLTLSNTGQCVSEHNWGEGFYCVTPVWESQMLPIEKFREAAVHCSLSEAGKLTRCEFDEPTYVLQALSFCSTFP